MKPQDNTKTLERFAFSSGYSRGDNAAAYETLSLEPETVDGWVEEFLEDRQLHFSCAERKPGVRELSAYASGCVLGFYASCEDHEIDPEMLGEVSVARAAAALGGWGEGILDE